MRITHALLFSSLAACGGDVGTLRAEVVPPRVVLTSHADGQTVVAAPPVNLAAEVTDPRFPPGVLTIAWTVDGQPACPDAVVHAAGDTTCTVVLGAGSHAIEVQAANPDHGAATATLTLVGSTAPSPARVAVVPSPATSRDALRCVVVEPARDPEGGETTLRLAWEQNGTTADVAPHSTVQVDDTVPAEATVGGDTWTCVATAVDPEGLSTTSRASVTLLSDTDADGIDDRDELAIGSDPFSADTDADGLTDGEERDLGTNPLRSDTDGDDTPDLAELQTGRDPRVRDSGFVAVATGQGTACGIRTDGATVCWGRNDVGQADPPPGPFVAVDLGDTMACGLRPDGTVTCWGAVEAGSLQPPAGLTFTAIDVGHDVACGVRTDGRATCWGEDFGGNTTPPVTETFTEVVAAGAVSCGLRPGGTAVCWGWDPFGRATPPQETFVALEGHASVVCGERQDGTLTCWGSDWLDLDQVPTGPVRHWSLGSANLCAVTLAGELECHHFYDPSTYTPTSPPPGARYLSVSRGSDMACAVRDDHEIDCWGTPSFARGHAVAPRPSPVVDLGFGSESGCVLDADGAARCWGSIGDTMDAREAAATFVDLDVAWHWACGLTTGGDILCWGSRDLRGETADAPGTDYVDVAVGSLVNCGLRADGEVDCWGRDAYGLDQIPTGQGFVDLVAGGVHVCGLTAAGQAVCWGEDAQDQSTPPTAETFVQLSVSGTHSCGLRADGSVRCWGDDSHGQAAGHPGPFVQIAAHLQSTCGLTAAGDITCWGDDTDRVQPLPAGPWASVVETFSGLCAMRAGGDIACVDHMRALKVASF